MTNSRAVSNRANAQLSTGPLTPAGKARSSQNALQHGHLSRKLLLPSESQLEFDALLFQLQSELNPLCTLELALVERIAIGLWRQRRLISAESAALAIQQQELGYSKVSRVMALAGLRDSERPVAEAMMREPPESDFTSPLLAELARFDIGSPLATFSQKCPQCWQYLCSQAETSDDAPSAQQLTQVSAYLQQEEISLDEWIADLELEQRKTSRLLQAVALMNQAAMLPQTADVLARYQSVLDNDVYKANRVLRETQKFRLEQAALNASAVIE
jgi:hypothetical protein